MATKEGWGFSPASTKWHYFVIEDGCSMGNSLCRKIGFFGGDVEKGNDNSPDNCKACIKRLAERREMERSG